MGMMKREERQKGQRLSVHQRRNLTSRIEQTQIHMPHVRHCVDCAVWVITCAPCRRRFQLLWLSRRERESPRPNRFFGTLASALSTFFVQPPFFFFFTRLSSASAEGTNVLGGRVFIASFFFFSLLFFFRIFYPMILIELCSVRIESVQPKGVFYVLKNDEANEKFEMFVADFESFLPATTNRSTGFFSFSSFWLNLFLHLPLLCIPEFSPFCFLAAVHKA